MKRLSGVVAVFIFLAVLLVPSNIFSCGMMIETRFVSKHFPDAPRQPYVAGKLGILWPGFERRYLVIAYRYLDNKPLAAAETKSLTDPMQPKIIAPGTPYDADPPVTLWLKARSQALGLKEVQKIDIQRYKVNGFEQYPNCGDDAFVTATATATSRAETFGIGSLPMREWVAGQDAVFQNCRTAQDLRWYGPDQKRPEAVLHQPAPVTLSNALLKLDRQYQVAAANFYGGNFETAAAEFEAIARDQKSPWHKQAQYLVARCYIRKATLDTTDDERFGPEPMSLAETRLKAILADKSLAGIHSAAQSLLDYVEARLHPEQRAHAIAKQLESGAGDEFEKKLFDYSYLLDHILEQAHSPEVKEQVKHYSGPATNEQMQGAAQVDTWRSEARKSGSLDDLTNWVLTFQVDSQLSSEYRFQRWQASKSLPCLSVHWWQCSLEILMLMS